MAHYKIGDIFQNLEIVACHKKPATYDCLCKVCGTIKNCKSMNFARKKTDRCKCFAMKHGRSKGLTDTERHLYKISQRAKGREIEFNITSEYADKIFKQQNYKCAYTGVELKIGKTASIDRIDSDLGYIEDNIQFVTNQVNLMKGALSHDEFLDTCKLITSLAYPNFPALALT